MPILSYKSVISLPRSGQCSLLGVAADKTVYVEIYYDDAWIAWYGLHTDGTIVMGDDEDSGRNRQFQLPAVEIVATPEPVSPSHPLNYAGPRLRGSRQSERVDGLVQPLDVAAKIHLVEAFKLPVSPMQLLGLAESTVLAKVTLAAGLQLVCRRLRLAYALAAPQIDADGTPYDYDSISLYRAHLFNPEEDHNLVSEALFEGLPGPELNQPTDSMMAMEHVFIAGSTNDHQMCQLHIWDVHPQ